MRLQEILVPIFWQEHHQLVVCPTGGSNSKEKWLKNKWGSGRWQVGMHLGSNTGPLAFNKLGRWAHKITLQPLCFDIQAACFLLLCSLFSLWLFLQCYILNSFLLPNCIPQHSKADRQTGQRYSIFQLMQPRAKKIIVGQEMDSQNGLLHMQHQTMVWHQLYTPFSSNGLQANQAVSASDANHSLQWK